MCVYWWVVVYSLSVDWLRFSACFSHVSCSRAPLSAGVSLTACQAQYSSSFCLTHPFYNVALKLAPPPGYEEAVRDRHSKQVYRRITDVHSSLTMFTMTSLTVRDRHSKQVYRCITDVHTSLTMFTMTS